MQNEQSVRRYILMHIRFAALASEDENSDLTHDLQKHRSSNKDDHHDCISEHRKPSLYTIGDAIQAAKIRKARLPRPDKDQAQRILNKIMLGCLSSEPADVQAESGPNLCANIHDECEKIEMMIDSGSSETVASQDKFPSHPLADAAASGTTYSSAAAKEAEQIVNVGQKYV